MLMPPPHALLTIENHGSFVLTHKNPTRKDIDDLIEQIAEIEGDGFLQLGNPDGVTQTCIPAKIFRENIFHLKLVN
jgi:hypothetical protein